jgi:phospholipid/cholesterol/gamma-HCH transport system permease protein
VTVVEAGVQSQPPTTRSPGIPGSGFVREAGDMISFVGRSLLQLGGAWRYFAEVLRQASLLVTGTTIVLVAMVGVIGGECALFGVYFLRAIGGDSFIGISPPICGLREMWPYMFGYLFAAKVGCGFVAEIGSMRISEEIDALESVGVDPMRYVVGTRLLATWLTVPFMYSIAMFFGALGGFLVAIVQFGSVSIGQFEAMVLGTWTAQDTLYSFTKTMTIATAIAFVGMYYGYKARGGPAGVGNATARSMVVNLVLIHVIGGVYSSIFWGTNVHLVFGG